MQEGGTLADHPEHRFNDWPFVFHGGILAGYNGNVNNTQQMSKFTQ
jgi:hypothetical protein